MFVPLFVHADIVVVHECGVLPVGVGWKLRIAHRTNCWLEVGQSPVYSSLLSFVPSWSRSLLCYLIVQVVVLVVLLENELVVVLGNRFDCWDLLKNNENGEMLTFYSFSDTAG